MDTRFWSQACDSFSDSQALRWPSLEGLAGRLHQDLEQHFASSCCGLRRTLLRWGWGSPPPYSHAHSRFPPAKCFQAGPDPLAGPRVREGVCAGALGAASRCGHPGGCSKPPAAFPVISPVVGSQEAPSPGTLGLLISWTSRLIVSAWDIFILCGMTQNDPHDLGVLVSRACSYCLGGGFGGNSMLLEHQLGRVVPLRPPHPQPSWLLLCFTWASVPPPRDVAACSLCLDHFSPKYPRLCPHLWVSGVTVLTLSP